MKKLVLALALLAGVTLAGAQDKVVEAARKAVDKAVATASNPKNANKANTWLKLGQAYMDAYNAAAGTAWIGINNQEFQMVVRERPVSEENVTLLGENLLKRSYPHHNYYFNGAGQLSLIEITEPLYDDVLGKALDAYKKYYSIDPKKAKEVSSQIQVIVQKYNDLAYSSYALGKYGEASELFEKAFNASLEQPYAVADTNGLYNTAFIAFVGEDFDRAKTYFEKCLNDFNYGGNDGDVYAKLADIYAKEGNTEAQLAKLEEGFTKYPQSQAILVGLINHYMSTGGDTGKLFELLEVAKNNEPNNPSLYYVEGNIHGQLGEYDEAVAAYRKCVEINPAYEFGYIGEGLLQYNKAIAISDEAQNEFNDDKYMALVAQFEQALKACISPFEKAFELTKDDTIKISVAEYLKNVYFRFRGEGDEYMAAYEKYNDYVNNNK